MTFTIKAAEEIHRRIEEHLGPDPRLWVGTIHSFCRHWILGPHKCYCPEVRFGLNIADEMTCRKILDELKRQYRINRFTQIQTRLGLDGLPIPCVGLDYNVHLGIVETYHRQLHEKRLIDHDLTLYYSYRLLATQPHISVSLSRLFQHLYVDEVQDLSELPHSILAQFLKHGLTSCFFVGDPDQAIYGSLGGIVKHANQVKAEYGLSELEESSLSNNYRSTQRIANFFSIFGKDRVIDCKAKYSAEKGRIAFVDEEPHNTELPQTIGGLISRYLAQGVPAKEICVLAPQWDHVFGMVRELIPALPGVAIDAPGICPFKEEDGFWHRFAQLYFGRPTPTNIRWRVGVARKLLRAAMDDLSVPTDHWSSRACLRLINSILSSQRELGDYLQDVLLRFLGSLNDNSMTPELEAKIAGHVGVVRSRILRWTTERLGPEFLYDTFSHSGVTVSTCHGVKGLEFEVVICFRLHEGWLPHWDHVYNAEDNGLEEARKLLYVISSRAKKFLHLFAERGYTTGKGAAYVTTPQLRRLTYAFDGH